MAVSVLVKYASESTLLSLHFQADGDRAPDDLGATGLLDRRL